MYRVSCTMVSMDEADKRVEASAEGRHPDICKQIIESQYKGMRMTGIIITNLNQQRGAWNDPKTGRPIRKTKDVAILDMERTWRKELAR